MTSRSIQEPCFDVLIATILLWVCIFGVVDLMVAELPNLASKLAAYGVLGLISVLFVVFTRSVTFCSLQ